MSRPRVIGLVGYAGSGKDTTAAFMQAHGDYSRYGMADPIKRMLMSLMGCLGYRTVPPLGDRWVSDFIDPYKPKLLGPTEVTLRYALQTLGTEWGRDLIDPNLWIMCARFHLGANSDLNIVISDVRFPNEADLVLDEFGGELWYIERGEQGMQHESEAYIAELSERCAITIDNTGSLEQLEHQVRELLA